MACSRDCATADRGSSPRRTIAARALSVAPEVHDGPGPTDRGAGPVAFHDQLLTPELACVYNTA